MHFGRVWTNHGNVFVLGFVEREKVSLVLQQNDCFMRRLQGELLMLWGVSYFFRVRRIDVGIVKEAGHEFCPQNQRDREIDLSFGHFSLFYLIDETGISVRERQLYVHA